MIEQRWELAAFAVGLAGTVLAWIAAIAGEAFEARAAGGRRHGRMGVVFWGFLGPSLGGQAALIVGLSVARGTIAVYNQLEFMLAFSWAICLMVAYFFVRRGPWWVAILALPVSFLMLGYLLLIPENSGEVSLVSMRSGWLLLHILTSIVAYAAFTVTFGAGVVILAHHYLRWGGRYAPEAVNRIGYRAAVFGFPFMTMVLFSGALWAKYIGGVYWAWDPIETWALVTWLIYSAYLHAQYTRGWESVRAAWLSVIGFVCVIGTYLFFTHLRF